jgi:hypothetical protein
MNRYRFYLLLTFICEECFIFTALAVGAGLFSAFSQYQAGKTAAKQAEYDAEYEAELRENQAEQERLNRLEAEKGERKMTARRRAAQRASYAKSGVLLEGTPLNLLSEQAAVDEKNIQQGNLESRQKRANLQAGAQAALTSGRNRASALRSGAKTSLLTGIGKTAVSGYQTYNWWDKNGSSNTGVE